MTGHGWSTTKTETGFKATVTRSHGRTTPNERGSYADVEVMQEAVFPTRAKAEGFAKRWTLYYRKTATK